MTLQVTGIGTIQRKIVARTLTRQMESTVTIESNADIEEVKIELEKSFLRKVDWKYTSAESAVWLWNELKNRYAGKCILLLESSQSPQLDNKRTLYIGMSKTHFAKEMSNLGCSMKGEGFIRREVGLFFWSLREVTKEALPILIEFLRIERHQFLIITEDIDVAEKTLVELVEERADGKSIDIDDPHTRGVLCRRGMRAIRPWGNFDDEELWIEIYAAASQP